MFSLVLDFKGQKEQLAHQVEEPGWNYTFCRPKWWRVQCIKQAFTESPHSRILLLLSIWPEHFVPNFSQAYPDHFLFVIKKIPGYNFSFFLSFKIHLNEEEKWLIFLKVDMISLSPPCLAVHKSELNCIQNEFYLHEDVIWLNKITCET